jgi:hypothetical protein
MGLERTDYNDGYHRCTFCAEYAEMKPAVFLSLFFFAQLYGCTHAQIDACGTQETRSACSGAMKATTVAREAQDAQGAKDTKDTKKANEPNEATDPKQSPAARRRVAPIDIQRAQPMPPLTTQRGQTVPKTPMPSRPATPSPIATCDAGGCWDNNANRYSGGASGTYIDNSGRPCHRIGTSMQCF